MKVVFNKKEKKSGHTTKQDLPNKKHSLLRNLNPPNHIEHIFPIGERSNNNLKNDLQENPSLGFKLQMRISKKN